MNADSQVFIHVLFFSVPRGEGRFAIHLLPDAFELFGDFAGLQQQSIQGLGDQALVGLMTIRPLRDSGNIR